MDTRALLRQTLAEFLEVPAEDVREELPLTTRRLQGSIGRSALDAVLRRRLGVSCRAVQTAATYGELERAVLGGDAPADNPPPAPAQAPAAPPAAADGVPGFACGIDVELVENLPQAADYWTDPFYASSFTPTEIAYCALQADPPMHFAARWCAKEALKKCEPSLLHEPMNRIELVNLDSGRPVLRRLREGSAEDLPLGVSVSHTPTAAVAMVLRVPPAGRPVPDEPRQPETPPRRAASSWSAGGVARWLLSVGAAALAAWALSRTF
jgi:phosphopantetheine--protein transferase-like protein